MTEAKIVASQPELITCGRCIRTIHMADAEAKAANARRRRDAP